MVQNPTKALRTKLKPLRLEFHVEIEGDTQTVEVYANIEGELVQVETVEDLRLGYMLRYGNKIYVASLEEIETLLAIKTLNPTIKNGKIISSINPKILAYLKGREHVKEGENLKQICLHKVPPMRCAKISYYPTAGLTVQTGYEVPGQSETVPKSVLHPMENGYVRVGAYFFPCPVEEDPAVQELLDREHIHVEPDRIPDFFNKTLPMIKANFKTIFNDAASKIQVINTPFTPKIAVDTEEGQLDVTLQYEAGGRQFNRKVAEEPVEYMHPDETTWVKVDRDKISQVEKEVRKLAASDTGKGFRTEITRFPQVEEFAIKVGGVKQPSAAYQNFLNTITDFHYNENFMLPEFIEENLYTNDIILRGYQRAGVHWLRWLTAHHLHGILADDMGLGKTIEMILAIQLTYLQTRSQKHTLIVCPRSVVTHWHREISRVFPEAHVREYKGTDKTPEVSSVNQPYLFVTTYDFVMDNIEALKDVPFLFVVLDEGTNIKNPETRRAITVKQLSATHRFVLTGTPIENRPAELWSIFDFLMRGHLGTYGGFSTNIETPILKGDKEITSFLSKRIRPFILRRMKEQVAKELPEKIYMNEWCSLTEEQRSLYGVIQEQRVSPLRLALQDGKRINYPASILPVLTKLKQLCDHPALVTRKKEPLLGRSEKFDFVADKLLQITGGGENVVLFSHFLGTLDLFEQFLKEKKVDYVRIDGSTQNRQQLIDEFNSKTGTVALFSIMAVGHGVNLTGANHVIHVDRWWNPALEDQATDRVHRIGQFKTVHVYKILTEGTLEERIDFILEKKRLITKSVIGAATAGEPSWTKEELLQILAPL